jgi:hypothetical protein
MQKKRNTLETTSQLFGSMYFQIRFTEAITRSRRLAPFSYFSSLVICFSLLDIIDYLTALCPYSDP